MTHLRYRCIAPDWLLRKSPSLAKVVEGEDLIIDELNSAGYNIYWLPNWPSVNVEGNCDGTHIDTWEYVYVDMDLKDGVYKSKEDFVSAVKFLPELTPTYIVDTGNGVHAYWRVTDLNAMDCLRLCRRLVRKFKTDEAVGKLYQLMRAIGTYNTKDEHNFKLCAVLFESGKEYTCEDLDKSLPRITTDDEAYCKRHYDATYGIKSEVKIDEAVPLKFKKLLKTSKEVRQLYAGDSDDRSRDDYRLAHILNAEGFSRAEAMSVLVNVKKAASRAPHHRVNYAQNIVEKVYQFEEEPSSVALSSSVRDILRRGSAVQGTRLPCHPMFDGTVHGFRLTEVLGLVGGAGSGKTTVALNYFWHFVKQNPEYIHLFVSLEQGEEEIALRWDKICDGNESLHDKVHVLGNYEADGSYRNLSLSEIEDYVLQMEKDTGRKCGAVVIDHIGVIRQQGKEGESQGLMDICHHMKAFAKRTNTFLVMQSQTSREKAGIGDLELFKDAAFMTSMFEWYVDFLVTCWQPLKRVYAENTDMTCSAFRYCKIRHKNVILDNIKEDSVYVLKFDVETERLRLMTTQEESKYEVLNKRATELRNKDRKREPTRITKIEWVPSGAEKK